MIIAEAVETQTARILFRLEEQSPITGVVAPVDGTGLQLTGLFLTSVDHEPVLTTGKAGWDNQSTGIAYYDPADTDLWSAKSPYYIRFQLTDVNNQIRYYPDHGRVAELKVHPLRG